MEMTRGVNHKVWVALLVAAMAAAMMVVLLVDGTKKPAHAGAFPGTNGKIAFSSDRDGNLEIYSMNASDGSNQTNLSNNSAYDRNPAYSPNGKKIAFSSSRDGNREIYIMDTDPATTDATRLTNNPAEDNNPSWQPLH
jgi:Tol biopolymer transport system component